MLYALSIKDFVLVDQLELEFRDGLTILTGETGAGKSILVDALGLVIGDRADSGLVRKGRDQTEISAAFDPTDAALAWLREHDFGDEECVIRRVISASGRSRGYINGRMATVQALRDLGETLVDIHSQHAHQSLLKPDIQRQLLDGMQAEENPTAPVRAAYQQWKELHQALHGMGGDAAERLAQINLLRYQVQELEALNPNPDDLTALEDEHRRLAHATQLLETGQRALGMLDGDEGFSALTGLNGAGRELDGVLNHDPKLQPIRELMETAAIQTREAADELRRYLDGLEIDPGRLQEVETRIGELQDAARKHQMKIDELPRLLERLRDQLQGLESFEERAATLETDLMNALHAYREAAAKLSAQRAAIAEDLAARVTANMQQLGMPKGRFFIAVTPHPDASPTPVGTDHIEFQVAANPGQDPGPLHKVASGGELSRISLSVQVITAQQSGVDSLVFDEVDVGVGGGVAEIVGQKLASLGESRQVLCITHLPQVAACGHQHLKVHKTVRDDTTHSELTWLDHDQRVEEVARMLGGLDITATTRDHAREMLAKGR